MPLIVEDGTGLPDAESYISVEEFKSYADAHGLPYSTSTDVQIEAGLRRGTAYIDGKYTMQNSCGRWESMFSGAKAQGRAQALQWPRSGATDSDGMQIASNEVPREIKGATAEAALREIALPGSLSPDYVAARSIKREKVGPLETEFAVSHASSGAGSVRPVITIVDEMLATLLGCKTYCGIAVFVV